MSSVSTSGADGRPALSEPEPSSSSPDNEAAEVGPPSTELLRRGSAEGGHGRPLLHVLGTPAVGEELVAAGDLSSLRTQSNSKLFCKFTWSRAPSEGIQQSGFASADTSFVPISRARGPFYHPQEEDVGYLLKVEAIPQVRESGDSVCSDRLFAVTGPVLPRAPQQRGDGSSAPSPLSITHPRRFSDTSSDSDEGEEEVVDGQGVVEAEQQARAAEEGEGVGGLRKHEPPCLQLATLEEAQESRAVALRPEPEPSGQGGEGAAAASPSMASSTALIVREAEATAHAQLFEAWRRRGADAATSPRRLGWEGAGGGLGSSSATSSAVADNFDRRLVQLGARSEEQLGVDLQRAGPSHSTERVEGHGVGGRDGSGASACSSRVDHPEVAHLRAALARLEAEKAETGRFLVQVAAEWEAAKANYEASGSIFTVREKRYRDREAKLSSDRKELLQELGNVRLQGQSLQKEVDILRMTEQQWAEKEVKWTAERKQLKTHVRELQAAAKCEAGRREAAHCDLSSLKAEMQAWQMQERQWEERRRKWKVKKDNLHTLVSSLQSDVGRIVEERNALSREKRSLAEDNAGLQRRVDALQSEMSALQSASAKEAHGLQQRLRETEAALLEEATKASAAQIEVMELTLTGSLASAHPALALQLHEVRDGVQGLRAMQRGLTQEVQLLQQTVGTQIGALLRQVGAVSGGGAAEKISWMDGWASGVGGGGDGGTWDASGVHAALNQATPASLTPIAVSPFTADISCIVEQPSSATATAGLAGDWGAERPPNAGGSRKGRTSGASPASDDDWPAQIEGAIPNWQYLLAKNTGVSSLWGPLAQVFLQDPASPEGRHAKALRQKWTDERMFAQPNSDFAVPPGAFSPAPSSSTDATSTAHVSRELKLGDGC